MLLLLVLLLPLRLMLPEFRDRVRWSSHEGKPLRKRLGRRRYVLRPDWDLPPATPMVRRPLHANMAGPCTTLTRCCLIWFT